MKHLSSLSTVFVAGAATVAGAQSLGTLTQNGTSMEVKSAVAVLTDGPALTFYLLPFAPSVDEIAKLQARETTWVYKKPSPDPKKWKVYCPYGQFELDWFMYKEAVGDPKKAFLHVRADGVSQLNVDAEETPTQFNASLTGAIKEGEEVTVISKGSDTSLKLDWDLKLKGKILPSKKSK
jgi:hypothetical protein